MPVSVQNWVRTRLVGTWPSAGTPVNHYYYVTSSKVCIAMHVQVHDMACAFGCGAEEGLTTLPVSVPILSKQATVATAPSLSDSGKASLIPFVASLVMLTVEMRMYMAGSPGGAAWMMQSRSRYTTSLPDS